MPIEPEREPNSGPGPGIETLLLLYLANRDGELSRRIGPREFESFVYDCLRSMTNELNQIEILKTKDLPIDLILREAHSAIVNSSRYDEIPTIKLGGERETEREPQYGELLARFFGRLHYFEYDLRRVQDEVSEKNRSTQSSIEEMQKSITRTTENQFSINWSLSLGASFGDMRTHRTAPIRIYTRQSMSLRRQRALQSAMIQLLDELGFEVDLDLPAEFSSFWKRFWVRTKNIANQKEVEDRFIKVEKALESRHIDKPQAEANKLNADSLSVIMDSIKEVDDACVQIGNILIVKSTSIGAGSGKARVLVRTLSPLEMHAIEQNQTLLKEPATILAQLEALQQEEGSALIENISHAGKRS